MRFLTRGASLMALALGVLASVALAPATPTRADDWCWNDPTLSINGRTVHIDVGAPVDKRTLVHASTIVVTVPINVDAQLTGTNSPNFPTDVTLVRAGTWSGSGAVPVTATAVVDVESDVPAGLKAWQSNSGATWQTSGMGGVTMTLSFGVQ